jgi:DNA-binding beta-propeller fold protein YncE
VSDRIYASVPSRGGALRGNTITQIDPHTGALGTSVFVVSEPTKLALTDDGSRLYVGSDSTNTITPISLSTMSPGTPFPIGEVHLRADDMETVAGNPRALAVTLKRLTGTTRGEGQAVFVDGIKLPKTTQRPGNVIEFGATPNVLYGYGNDTHGNRDVGSFSIDLSPTGGIQFVKTTTGLVPPTSHQDMEYDNGRLYFTSGQIIETSGPSPVGSFDATGPLEPVSSTRRTYFVQNDTLKAFSQATFVPLGTLTIPHFAGTAKTLIALGASAVTFTTTSDQLFIVRLHGDYDASGVVSLADYDVWRANYGSVTSLTADANRDGVVDAVDYVTWRDNVGQSLVGSVDAGLAAHGAVPEPATWIALSISIVLSSRRLRPGESPTR